MDRFFPVFNKSRELSSHSLAIGEVAVQTTSNGIASAVNDEAGSNSVDGGNEEVANEGNVESEEDEATVGIIQLVLMRRIIAFQ